MNIQTFFEAVFYVLDKLTLMFLAFVIIYASFKVGTKSHLMQVGAVCLRFINSNGKDWGR